MINVCGAAEPMPMGRTESLPPAAARAEGDLKLLLDTENAEADPLRRARDARSNFIFSVICIYIYYCKSHERYIPGRVLRRREKHIYL